MLVWSVKLCKQPLLRPMVKTNFTLYGLRASTKIGRYQNPLTIVG